MASEPFDPQDWREWRRMQAWRLKQLGWKQRDIAVVLDVTEGAVSQWMATARSEGPAALLAHPSPGHPPKLGLDQLHSFLTSCRMGRKPTAFAVRSGPAPRRQGHPRGVRRFLPSGPRLPAPEGTALDATTADRAGHPARRAGDRAMASRGLASAQGRGPPRAPRPGFRG